MCLGEIFLTWHLVECLLEGTELMGTAILVFVDGRMTSHICFHYPLSPGVECVGERHRASALLWSLGLLVFIKSP